jgi:uncharacterized protein YihD (DUF1040 family)
MRDPKRIESILHLIKKVWKQHPDWRLCQLLSNVAVRFNWNNLDLFYLEDDMLQEGLNSYLTFIHNSEKRRNKYDRKTTDSCPCLR